jgi:hypothetical protein
MRATYSVLLFLFLAGCATIPSVTLQHPTTGKKVQCPGDAYTILDPGIGQLIESIQQSCIVDYQNRGYERVDTKAREGLETPKPDVPAAAPSSKGSAPADTALHVQQAHPLETP